VWLLSLFALAVVSCAERGGDLKPETKESTVGRQTSKLALWYRQPAKEWVEALPIGNGRLGAMVFGGVYEERLQLNEDTVWAGGPYDPTNPEALEALPKARELIFAGEYKQAHELIKKKMMAKPLRQMPYQPVGDLRLEFHDDKQQFIDYRRELDLATAIARVCYSINGVRYERETFASAVDQVIVVHLTADKPGSVAFSATMDSLQKVTVEAVKPDSLVMNGISGDARGIKGSVAFQCRVRIQTDGGRTTQEKGKLAVVGANSATLLIAAATNYVNYTIRTSAATRKLEFKSIFRKLAANLMKSSVRTISLSIRDYLAVSNSTSAKPIG